MTGSERAACGVKFRLKILDRRALDPGFWNAWHARHIEDWSQGSSGENVLKLPTVT